MPRIRFTADPKLPRDLADLGYRNGVEVDLSDDQANRWLRRGVAVVMPDAPVVVAPVVDDEPEQVAIPDDWEDLHHMSRISLARRLTDGVVETASEADAVITAEIDRRTQPA